MGTLVNFDEFMVWLLKFKCSYLISVVFTVMSWVDLIYESIITKTGCMFICQIYAVDI